MIEFVRALEHLHIRKIGPNEGNNPINLSAKSDELIKLEKSLPYLKTLDVPMVNVSTVHFSSTANKLRQAQPHRSRYWASVAKFSKSEIA